MPHVSGMSLFQVTTSDDTLRSFGGAQSGIGIIDPRTSVSITHEGTPSDASENEVLTPRWSTEFRHGAVVLCAEMSDDGV